MTSQPIIEPAITWHGTRLGQPDWGDNSHTLTFTLRYGEYGELRHVLLNMFWKPLTFSLPSLERGQYWRRIIDTALPSPQDISPVASAPCMSQLFYKVKAPSTVVLMSVSELIDLYVQIVEWRSRLDTFILR